MTDTLTLVSEGERRVIAISLPKNPDSPSRKVTLENNLSGWVYAELLGDIKIGDLVSYKIVKNAEGYQNYKHIAPVSGKGQDQMAGSEPVYSHDDAPGGGGPSDEQRLANTTPAERDGPRLLRGAVDLDDDTSRPLVSRFESYSFVANCGMVELAFEELSDAQESGELEKITPELLKTVATHLLTAADKAQRDLVGRVDRASQSHTRARGCVRTALRKYPVREWLPTALDEWADALEKHAVRLLMLAATL